MNVPASVTVATSAAIGSAAGDILTDYVIKSMGQDKAIKNLESVAIKLGLAGASTVGSLKLVSGIDPSLVGFATGSLGKFVGDGIYNQADNFYLDCYFKMIIKTLKRIMRKQQRNVRHKAKTI